MPDQTKQKIEAWVEEEVGSLAFYSFSTLVRRVRGEDEKGLSYTGRQEDIKRLLQDAIIFGLELGKEAGPKKEPEDQFGGQFPVWSAVGFNEALTAKNAEIEKLIEEVKCL